MLILILQIMFNVNNGKGDISIAYKFPRTGDLCNGQWHTIVGQCIPYTSY